MRTFLVLLSLVTTLARAFGAQVEVVAHLKLRNEDAFERMFFGIATPGDPSFGHFLTLADVRDFLGNEATRDVQEWLMSFGPETLPTLSPLMDTVSAVFDESRVHEEILHNKSERPTAVEFVLLRRPKTAHPIFTATSQSERYASSSSYTVSNIKKAYGIPTDLTATNESTLQMVWGPGTFGYSKTELELFKLSQCPLLNTSRVKFDTQNHGESGGDNFGEGMLDTKMISAFGLNVNTLVSNTNTSASTEEGEGFGQALLDFLTSLASRSELPHVLSLSLGSLSSASCRLLCEKAAEEPYNIKLSSCNDFLQSQRQVCMYISEEQTARINTALQILGSRGVSIFGSSGDGGSHFSFGQFSGGNIADALNEISCTYQMPVYPTASPYIVSVGGEMWDGGNSKHPITWAGYGGGSGGGFSWQFGMPDYQVNATAKYLGDGSSHELPPASSFNRSGRAYPDISGIGVSGTSQSSPLVAGIFSLIMDARLNSGLGRLGFLGPRIWAVASKFPNEAFEDISEGNSKTSCDTGFGSAKGGWDPNTGWGRPVWAGLEKYFASDSWIVPARE